MKIAYVQPHTPEATSETDRDLSDFVGYPNFHFKILSELGYDGELLSLTHGDTVTTADHEFGHQVIEFPVTVGESFGSEFSLALLNYLRRCDADLIHIRGYTQHNVLPFLPLLTRIKPTVVQHLGEAHTYSRNNLKHRIAIRVLRSADMICALDPNEVESLTDGGFPRSKVHHLPNAVNTELFYPMGRRDAAEMLNIDPDRHYVLFVGRIVDPKNVPVLIRAMDTVRREHPNTKLLIAGNGSESEVSNVQTEIDKQGLENRVRLVGHVSQPKLLHYYNVADVAVFPSSIEGLGMVALEAGACKTPIVVTRAHRSSVFVNGDNCLMVDPTDANSVAQGVQDLLSDKDLAAELATQAYKDVLDTYHPEAIAEEIKKIYEKAIEHYRNDR